nr:polygalacturonase-like [Ipomoea batatas]GME09586.1 polygalacturonase-like [Ipomoea batatas]
MWSKLLCALPFVLFLVAYPGESAEINVAAKPNVDVASELLNAWKEGCAATMASTIVIPKGTYPMTQVVLAGPCKAPIELQILGTLEAPSDDKTLDTSKEWLTVQYVDGFTLTGGGIFDGQGTATWEHNDCKKTKSCNLLPNNLSFNFLTNSLIRTIVSLDSKLFHVHVLGGKNITFDHLLIKAPGTSHYTDGIHVAKATDVTIMNSIIGTGDDCISVGDGTQNLVIKGVVCGPGHGISINVGKAPGEEPVKGVHVQDCKFIGTDNGLRIITWPNSQPGEISDVHYEHIEMEDVDNPILIDQEYCPHRKCPKDKENQKPSQVKISKVSYKKITGASGTDVAVSFTCSSAVPCEGVEVSDINLTFNGAPAKSICSNIKPVSSGKIVPPLCT